MSRRDPATLPTPEAYAAEAVHYYHNARQILRSVPIRQDRYMDVKPVRDSSYPTLYCTSQNRQDAKELRRSPRTAIESSSWRSLPAILGDLAVKIRGNSRVREACATAYLAVLAAVRSFLLSQGLPAHRLPESYDAYCQFLHRHNARNGKVMHAFFDVYSGLHLDGYYRGFSNVEFGKHAFGQAQVLIERLTGRKVDGA